MRTTRQMSVTLPLEMADIVRARVESAEYASEREVIGEGLRSLAACERSVESWLRNQVVPAYDRPSAVAAASMSADQVRARLAEPTDR